MSGIAAMRIQVSVFGTFQGIRGARIEPGMQVIIKASRQRRADSCYLRQIRDPGTHDALQPTEVLEQLRGAWPAPGPVPPPAPIRCSGAPAVAGGP